MGPPGPAGTPPAAGRPWRKNPNIIIPSIVAIVAATLGVVIPLVFSGGDRSPEVTNISPSKVVPGNQFDIHGKNLDLVSEVLFAKGATQIRLDVVRQQRTLWTVIPSADDVSPDEYSLTIKTIEGKLVPTGINVVVGDGFVKATEPTDTPEPEPTDTPALPAVTVVLRSGGFPLQDLRIIDGIFFAVPWSEVATELFGVQDVVVEVEAEGGTAVGDTTLLDYDPDRARRLLAEAGYSDGFSLAWRVGGNDQSLVMGEMMKINLAQVGLQLELIYDAATFLAIKRTNQAWLELKRIE